MPIPSILTHRLRETLAQHPALADDRTLRAVFVDERLAPWRNRTPENTSDRAARVAALIGALCDQENTQGENALVLFLRVLAEQTPSGDALHNTLITLAARLEPQPFTALAAFKIPAPVGSITITDTGNVVGNDNTVTINKPTTVGGNIHFHEPPPPERPAHPLWERFRNHPLIFYSTVIFSVIAAIVGLIGVLISAGADFGGAVDQFREWGLVRGFPKERKGEVLIVIASFYYSDESLLDTTPHNEIKRAIEREVQALDFTNLRVEVAPDRLQADDRAGAQALGDRYDASLVIWGADTGVRVSVNFYNHKQPNFVAADVRIEETIHTQIAAPNEYAEFITQDLPNQLTFLSLFAMGQSYLATEAYTDSVQVTEAAVAQLGDSPTIKGAAGAYALLGWLHSVALPTPDYILALADLNRAIELDPQYVEAYHGRAYVYLAMEDYHHALADYTRIIKLDPQFVAAYRDRGSAYYALDDYNNALADLNRAIELDPQDTAAYRIRGAVYYDLDDDNNAFADLNRAIELDPQYTAAYRVRGSVYYDLDDYNNALADFNRAIELDSEYARAYHYRGMIYCAMGNYPDAIADLDRAIEIDPQDTIAYLRRAYTYYQMGDYDHSIADLDRAVELNPTSAQVYYVRGGIYYEIGEYDNARADIQHILDTTDDPELRAKAEAALNELNAANP